MNPECPNLDVSKANAHVGEGAEPSAYKRMSERIPKLWLISSSLDSTLPSFDKRLIFVEIHYSLCIFCHSILFNVDHPSVDSSVSTRSGVARVKNVHFLPAACGVMTPSHLPVVPQEEDARADEKQSSEFSANQWSPFQVRSPAAR
ncbi:hypothetical protein CEXT_344191 [Caerostris extrusa]|uniref:Uncharacterized protein n=1 Tax=Caerostris extrusa TaxID=172846 RepID=A0AAV4XZP0_CAEEX|nr:hypothetical protein CEXT_344191 [Caerostris extrusa]